MPRGRWPFPTAQSATGLRPGLLHVHGPGARRRDQRGLLAAGATLKATSCRRKYDPQQPDLQRQQCGHDRQRRQYADIDGQRLGQSSAIVANQNAAINADLALGAAQTWTLDSGKTFTVGGPVSGAFGLTLAGGGTLAVGAPSGSGGTTGSLANTAITNNTRWSSISAMRPASAAVSAAVARSTRSAAAPRR